MTHNSKNRNIHFGPWMVGLFIVCTLIAGCKSNRSKDVSVEPSPVPTRPNIQVGDTVECPRCAGNNVVQVTAITVDGMATIRNPNNDGLGNISVLNLVKLADPQPIKNCVSDICKGDSVFVNGSVGSGENLVRVVQLFSNDTANVQGLGRGEVSTYRISRLRKQGDRLSPAEQSAGHGEHSFNTHEGVNEDAAASALALDSTCVGPTSNYTNCEGYCVYVGKRCSAMCTSPAGRLNQAASAWVSGSNCSGIDAGGDVPCTFNFDDAMNATPRWRCCCR